MFPHYICPECGTDYGTKFSLANNHEHQYCDLCEGENSRLIPISSRKEYKEKITKEIIYGNNNPHKIYRS